MCKFPTQQIYHQLRCSYESQIQPHPQELQSPIIWSAMSHPELYRNGSPCESDHSPQPRGSVFELIHPMDRHCLLEGHKYSTCSEPRLSTSLYPPVVFSSAEDGHNMAATLSNNEIQAKRNLFKTKAKSWVSYDGLEMNCDKANEHRLSLSAGVFSLKGNSTAVNNNFLLVQKHLHTRSQSLGLNRTKK